MNILNTFSLRIQISCFFTNYKIIKLRLYLKSKPYITKIDYFYPLNLVIYYYYLFYLLPDSVPFSGPCRLLPIYIGKIPIGGKNLSISFQLVLRVPPSPSLYIFVSQSALCTMLPGYVGRSRGEGGSRRVWRFASVPPMARRGVTSP